MQIRKDFIELLREHTEIDRHSRWSDVKKKIDSDSRYRMVDSSSLREDYFREYIRMLKDEKRHKEKERSRKEKVEKDRDQESDPVSIDKYHLVFHCKTIFFYPAGKE